MKCILTQQTYQFFFYINWVATGASGLVELYITSILSVLSTCLQHQKTIHVRNVIDQHVQAQSPIFWKIPFFGGIIHESTRSIHCSLLITFTGEVFLTRCRGTESKKSFFSLYRYWRTADCIISKQPFLTTSLLVSMSNFAYPYVETCIRNFATNTRNEQLAIRNYSN